MGMADDDKLLHVSFHRVDHRITDRSLIVDIGEDGCSTVPQLSPSIPR